MLLGSVSWDEEDPEPGASKSTELVLEAGGSDDVGKVTVLSVGIGGVKLDSESCPVCAGELSLG